MIVLMVAMVNLAIWQYHRYEGKRDRRDAVAARQLLAPVPVDSVLSTAVVPSANLEWTIVKAAGSYDAAAQILIKDRSLNGFPGFHVVTPLKLSSGTTLLVNRGFIDLALEHQAPPPPTGTVTVVGRLRPAQHRGSLGPRDPATGVLTEFARVDVERIAKQLTGPVLGDYVELTTQTPLTSKADPQLIPPPDPDLGPHLSYMGQWLIFTVCAAAGWVIVVRRTARKQLAAPERIDRTEAVATEV
jgi:surfeit locus 1 family protein